MSLRVVLQVAVHGDQHLAAGVIDAGHHGRGLTGIAAELDEPQVRVGARQLQAALEGLVLAAVVDEHDLGAQAERPHGLADRLVEEMRRSPPRCRAAR